MESPFSVGIRSNPLASSQHETFINLCHTTVQNALKFFEQPQTRRFRLLCTLMTFICGKISEKNKRVFAVKFGGEQACMAGTLSGFC